MRERDFYTAREEAPRQYPWLSGSENCEVAVVGGGVAGCAAAWHLARAGIDTVLVTRRPVGFSCVAVGDSVLDGCNRMLLARLSQQVGRSRAMEVWRLCKQALDELEQFSLSAPEIEFRRRDGLLYVSDPQEAEALHTEYRMRRHNGFEVRYLDQKQAGELFSFRLEGGILSGGQAAECNGYRLCHALAAQAADSGARIYENTALASIEETDKGVRAATELGRVIRARRLILATGRHQEEYLPIPVVTRAVFHVVSEPVGSFAGYESGAVIRNATEGMTVHRTGDSRIAVSGWEGSFPEPDSRLSRLVSLQRLAQRRYARLREAAETMLCGMGELPAAYGYRGIYGVTPDGLPAVGAGTEYRHIWFDFPSGPNGIVFGWLSAQVLAHLYQEREDAAAELFSPLRRRADRQSL